MKVHKLIARRYLFSKKSHNAINIITGIAIVGIAVGSMALIIVLSGFNGLQTLVEDMYSSFDPDVKITPASGKTFEERDIDWDQLKAMPEIAGMSRSLEETALIKYKERQSFATIKGVDENFGGISGVDTSIYDGAYSLNFEGKNFAVMGYGVANQLQVYTRNIYDPIVIFAAKRNAKISADPTRAFSTNPINVSGIFNINADVDFKYVLVPLEFSRQIFDHKAELSSIEVNLNDGVDHEEFKEKLQMALGPDYEVKTRYELNELLFKTNRTEKWITYLILTFILVIASFNLIASLTILIIDKRGDIAILRSMGADKALIRMIFIREGLLIAFLGGGLGMLIGLLLTLGQQYIGLIRLGADSIVEYYPMELDMLDFLAVLSTVLVLGFIAAWLPVRFVLRKTLV